LQYGSSLGSPQARANICSDATHGGLIPGSAIGRRLINPVGFDKAKLTLQRRTAMAADPKARKSPAVTAGLFVFRVPQLVG
jgi:hypothetical protein